MKYLFVLTIAVVAYVNYAAITTINNQTVVSGNTVKPTDIVSKSFTTTLTAETRDEFVDSFQRYNDLGYEVKNYVADETENTRTVTFTKGLHTVYLHGKAYYGE